MERAAVDTWRSKQANQLRPTDVEEEEECGALSLSLPSLLDDKCTYISIA